MKKIKILIAIALIASLSACSTTETDIDLSELDKPAVEDTVAEELETAHKQTLLEAKLGDTIPFNDYCYSVANGCKSYYVTGRYVITVDNVVMQIREELEVADASTTIKSIIEKDSSFDLNAAEISFYGSDGTATTADIESTVNATVTDCVIEQIEWLNEEKTYGAVQSYLFSYGYVPVKISGYYDATAEGGTTTTTTVADTAVPETTVGDETTTTTTAVADTAVSETTVSDETATTTTAVSETE